MLGITARQWLFFSRRGRPSPTERRRPPRHSSSAGLAVFVMGFTASQAAGGNIGAFFFVFFLFFSLALGSDSGSRYLSSTCILFSFLNLLSVPTPHCACASRRLRQILGLLPSHTFLPLQSNLPEASAQKSSKAL